MTKDISKDYNRYIDIAITLLEEMKIEEGTRYFDLNKSRHDRMRLAINEMLNKAHKRAYDNRFTEDD